MKCAMERQAVRNINNGKSMDVYGNCMGILASRNTRDGEPRWTIKTI